MANFYLAFESDLTVIPVLNKIDLKIAKPDEVLVQIKNVFDISPEHVLKVSLLYMNETNKVIKECCLIRQTIQYIDFR